MELLAGPTPASSNERSVEFTSAFRDSWNCISLGSPLSKLARVASGVLQFAYAHVARAQAVDGLGQPAGDFRRSGVRARICFESEPFIADAKEKSNRSMKNAIPNAKRTSSIPSKEAVWGDRWNTHDPRTYPFSVVLLALLKQTLPALQEVQSGPAIP